MVLLSGVSKRNSQVLSCFPKRSHVENRASMILRGMSVKYNMGFSKVNFLAISLTKKVKDIQQVIQAFITALTEKDNIICESKMKYI